MAVIPGLTGAESDAYVAALMAPGAQTHRRATRTDLDLSHDSMRRVTDILGGQVRWNGEEDVRTEGTVIFSDFDDRIDYDLRHMVRLELGVTTAASGVVWAPLMTGWVQACNDTGWETEVVLHGKEKFGLRATEHGRAKRGERVGEVVWRMHHGIGERHIVIPDHLRESGPKLADAVEWGGSNPKKSVTVMSRRLARRAELQVFFDQLGRLDLRPVPEHPRVSFTETRTDEDVEVRLLAPIAWASDFSEVCNRVIGAGRRDLRSVAHAKGVMGGLSRGGDPLRLTHRFSDDTLDSRDELRDVTERTAARMGKAFSQVAITSTPAPWLLAEDKLRAVRRDGRVDDFWMGSGSLELDGSSMAIGYQQVLRRSKGVRVETTGRGYTDKERREMRREARRREQRRAG